MYHVAFPSIALRVSTTHNFTRDRDQHAHIKNGGSFFAIEVDRHFLVTKYGDPSFFLLFWTEQ